MPKIELTLSPYHREPLYNVSKNKVFRKKKLPNKYLKDLK